MPTRTLIAVCCILVTTTAYAQERNKVPDRPADRERSDKSRAAAKPHRVIPKRDPTLLRCGGSTSSLCIHPVF